MSEMENHFIWNKQKKLSQQLELTLLISLVYLEARDQDFQGKIAVCHVVYNRYLNKKRWANTIAGVILQPYQFSCFNDFNIYKNVFDPPERVWNECFQPAWRVYSGQHDDPTNGADHYYNPKLVIPYWGKDRNGNIIPGLDIGNHRFLKLG